MRWKACWRCSTNPDQGAGIWKLEGIPPPDGAVRYAIMAASKNEVNSMDENRSKALAAALSQIEKQFGKGSIMRLGEKEVAKDLDVVSTGSLGLDPALGLGGLPRGRVVE